MNPGYKTTEFWLTAIASIFTVLGTIGVITPTQASAASAAVTQIISGIVGLSTIIYYIYSRTQLKSAAIAAGIAKPQ